MSEQNAEMGERRRRREEERRRLAGESVAPAEPSAAPPVPTTLSRRELRERAAAQGGPVAAPTSAPPPASPPPASPRPASQPVAPPMSPPMAPSVPPSASPSVQRPVAPVSQPVPQAVPPVQEVRPSRRDLRERAADLHPQPDAAPRPQSAARETAASGPAPLAAQAPRPAAFVSRPAVQTAPPGVVAAAPAAQVQQSPQAASPLSPQAASPLSPQARAAAIRAQAARAQAEREEAARLQVERAQTQRAQQRPAVQPPSGIWNQASTQAQPTDAAASRSTQRPEAFEEQPTGPRPFVGPRGPAFQVAPAAPATPNPAAQAALWSAATPRDVQRPGQESPRPAQLAPSAGPTAWSSTPEHDPATAVRRVVLPPMGGAPEPIALPSAQSAPAVAPERATAWNPGGGYAPAPSANGAPAAGPVRVPGIVPDGSYQPVISPAQPVRLNGAGPNSAGPNSAGPNGAVVNGTQAGPVVRQAAFGAVGTTAPGQRFEPVGPADRDAAATAVQAFPRVEPAGPPFARGVDAAVSVPPFARTGAAEAPAADAEAELPRWGSLGWTPAPTSTPTASPAVVPASSAASGAAEGFGGQRGFGAVSGFGSATGFGALVDSETDADSAVEAGAPSASRRSERESATDGEDESTHHPYTWLHMIVLVVVAFILGMLIFMVLMQDNSSDAGATGALADPQQIALVADAGPGA